MQVCPAGHFSQNDEVCDRCGLPMAATAEYPVVRSASSPRPEDRPADPEPSGQSSEGSRATADQQPTQAVPSGRGPAGEAPAPSSDSDDAAQGRTQTMSSADVAAAHVRESTPRQKPDEQARTQTMPGGTQVLPAEPVAGPRSTQVMPAGGPDATGPILPPPDQAATEAVPVAEVMRRTHAAGTVLPDEAPARSTRVMPGDNPAATSLMPVTGAVPAPLPAPAPGQAPTEAFAPPPDAGPPPAVGRVSEEPSKGPAAQHPTFGAKDVAADPPTGATALLGARTPAHWHAVLTVDAAWYAVQETEYRMPPEGTRNVVQLKSPDLTLGRVSRSRGTAPDIDCSSDPGVSRRHARFRLIDRHWFVEDLGSANGTFVAQAGAPLPQTPIPPGRRVEIGPGDTVYVGAWTRIMIEDDDAWGAG